MLRLARHNATNTRAAVFRLLPVVCLLLSPFLPPPCVAARQTEAKVRRIRFARGRSTVVLTGVLRPGTGEARHEYLLRAKAGQRISVSLTSNRVRLGAGESAGAVFFVLDENEQHPPDFGDYPYGGPTSWEGRLPKSGEYRVRVLMEDGPDDPSPRALRRMKLTLRYRLKVTLAPV